MKKFITEGSPAGQRAIAMSEKPRLSFLRPAKKPLSSTNGNGNNPLAVYPARAISGEERKSNLKYEAYEQYPKPTRHTSIHAELQSFFKNAVPSEQGRTQNKDRTKEPCSTVDRGKK